MGFGFGGELGEQIEQLTEETYRTSSGIIELVSPFETRACREVKRADFRRFHRPIGTRDLAFVVHVTCDRGVEEWLVNRTGLDTLRPHMRDGGPSEAVISRARQTLIEGRTEAEIDAADRKAVAEISRAKSESAAILAAHKRQISLSSAFANVVRQRFGGLGSAGETAVTAVTVGLWGLVAVGGFYVVRKGAETVREVRRAGGRRGR